MSTRLRHVNSLPSDSRSNRRPHSRTRLRPRATALLLMLGLGSSIALRGNAGLKVGPVLQQSGDQSVGKPPAGTYSLLYSFDCKAGDGANPAAGLVPDSAGNLYGTTKAGGAFSQGTVFKITPGGIETVLHSFAGSPSDGSEPLFGSLMLDAAGNIYGTTLYGGNFGPLGYGTVFEVTAAGTESVLYNFTGSDSDGEEPWGGVVRDSAGNLYGTTYFGGAYDFGTVFKLTPGGTVSVLHSFSGTKTDGAEPASNLTVLSGNMYGTTSSGGAYNAGTVFKVNAAGSESLFHSFANNVDGSKPQGGGLLRDNSGTLYGVTWEGGADNAGAVFKLTSGGMQRTTSFNGGTGGASPIDGLARDDAGNLYGTTENQGSGSGCGGSGCGVLFELTPADGEIVLHNFTLTSSDGVNPEGGVIRDPSGNLYGTLLWGGTYGCGAVFKYTP